MSDFPDSEFGYDELPPEENPFYGLEGFDEFSEFDPYENMEQQVLYALGVEDFDEVIIDISDAKAEDLRGNRFESLTEALTYLYDSGILRFSKVVIEDDEIMVAILKGSP